MDRRAFLAAATAFAAAPAFAQETDGLQAMLDRARIEAGVPAMGAAIVTPDALAWSGVSGVQRRDADAPVTADARWHLGSNTKAMTAALYARRVEQGRAAWGAPVASFFPDLQIDPAWAAITIEQLLGHRAGVLDPEVMPVWMMAAWAGPDRGALRTDLARRLLGAAPAGPVGAFAYSNAGYILAGAALERIGAAPWEEQMTAEIFAPLGMASAGFGAPADGGPWGHQGAAMTPMAPTLPNADNPAALGPAGTVHASLTDYARFLRVFLNGGAGWLSADSLNRLTTPVPGDGQAYALGWGVLEQPWSGGSPAFTHDGSNTLWLARAVVAPGRRAAAIIVANAADPARPAVNAMTRALIEAFPS